MRRALYELLLFILPFALYFIYTRLAPRDEEGQLGHDHPWLWLFVSGLVLVIVGFVWVGVTEGSGSTGVYVPAHQENGHVVPGRFDEPTRAPAPAASPAAPAP